MLAPEQITDAAEAVADVYRQIEAELIDYLVQKMIEGDVSGQRTQTAINLLAQTMPPELQRMIEAHSDEIDAAVRSEVKRSLAASDAFDLAAMGVAYGMAADALTAQTAAVVASARRMVAADNLALSEAARAKFVQWSTWAVTQVATGNMTAPQALRRAVRELSGEGLAVPFVAYRGDDGKVTVRNRVDVAVQRHIRTLITQGAAELTMARMRENGVEFVEVSSHIGSRPSHAEWQGRVYHVGGAVEVDGVRYDDFEFGTGYNGVCGPYAALGDRLLGVNCRHSFAPWVPGSPRAYSPNPESPTGLDEGEVYDLTQGQRLRERRIREAKRQLAAAQRLYEADPTPENLTEATRAKGLLRNRQENLREYIRTANAKCKPGTQVLKRQPNREWAGDMPRLLSDIKIGRSVGAAAFRDAVLLPDGSKTMISEGTSLTGVRVIAGNGVKRKIDCEDVLVQRYGGKRGQWKKLRGTGYVDDLGMSRQCELHWYEGGDGKRVDMKVKRFYY